MTGPDRRRLLGMLAVLVAMAAIVAALVASAGRPAQRTTDRLQATGSLDDGDTTTSVALDATSSTEPAEPPSTEPTAPIAPTTSATPTASSVRTTAPPPTTAAAPTTAVPGLPPPTLDVGPASCGSPVLVRAGAFVGVQLPDGIHEVSLDGRVDVLLPDTADATGAAWSPDGRRLAYVRRSATRTDANHYAASDLVVVDRAAGCSRVFAGPGADSLTAPAWSPDGSTLAYLRQVGAPYSSPRALETVKADGTGVARLATGNLLGGTWAPDTSGRIAYGQDGGLRVRSPDGKVTVVDATTGGAEFQSWSPDATTLVYTISVHQGIWVGNADGSGYRDLSPKGTRNPNGIFWSRFSPDGRRIVFAWAADVWVEDADGGNGVKLATSSGTGGPFWSPAGDEVVFGLDGAVRAVPVTGGESRLVHAGQVLAVFERD